MPIAAPPPCRLLRRGLDYEIVIVEDSSPDGTYEVAVRLQEVFGAGAVKILKRPGKLGLGSAYIDGLKLVTGDFVFIMDADLSHHVRTWRGRREDVSNGRKWLSAEKLARFSSVYEGLAGTADHFAVSGARYFLTRRRMPVTACRRSPRRSPRTLQSSGRATTTSSRARATSRVRVCARAMRMLGAHLSLCVSFLRATVECGRLHSVPTATPSRCFHHAGGGVSGWDLYRKVVSRGANSIATLLLAPRASDLTGSYRLYKRSVLEAVIPQVGGIDVPMHGELLVQTEGPHRLPLQLSCRGELSNRRAPHDASPSTTACRSCRGATSSRWKSSCGAATRATRLVRRRPLTRCSDTRV